MYEAGRSGFRSLRTCWEFGWEPKFTELGDREDGLREKETLPKMKGVVQARRYIGDLARVPLGKEGRGTLEAIWCGGSWELSLRAWAPPRLAFGPRSGANRDLQTKAIYDALD